jgi:hypothetical protein
VNPDFDPIHLEANGWTSRTSARAMAAFHALLLVVRLHRTRPRCCEQDDLRKKIPIDPPLLTLSMRVTHELGVDPDASAKLTKSLIYREAPQGCLQNGFCTLAFG